MDIEDLKEILIHDGFKVLMKQISDMVESQERAVLALELTNQNQLELVIKKARAEGARRLQTELIRRLEQVKQRKP